MASAIFLLCRCSSCSLMERWPLKRGEHRRAPFGLSRHKSNSAYKVMVRCFRGGLRTLTGVSSSDDHVSERSSNEVVVLAADADRAINEISQTGAPDRPCKRLRASIWLKLTIFICLLVIIASGIPAIALWIKVHDQLIQQIKLRLTTVSTLRQEQLEEYLLNQMDKTSLITTRVLIIKYLITNNAVNKSVVSSDLKLAIGVIEDFKDAVIYDQDGLLAIATNKFTFDRQLNPSFLNSLVSQEPRFDIPVLWGNGWVYNLSRGIFQNKKRIGVLMATVNASNLASLVYDRTGLQTTGELLVGIPDGSEQVRLLLPPLANPHVTALPYDSGGAMAKAINGESGVMTLRDYSNRKVIAAYRPVGFSHWGLLAKLQIREAYAPVHNVRLVIVVTIVVLLIVGIIASLVLAKIFTSPISELSMAAAALGRGDLSTRVRKGSPLFRDEISDLKDAFNTMVQQIAGHQYILEYKVQERTCDLACANNGLARQIEERRKIELELEKAKDVAMSANRSKSEFLANMSHEIRTPLNAIINFTELCLDTEITPEQQEHLDYVLFAAQHLLRLITDILDFSKIEAGKLEMEEIQFSLCEQLEHAVTVLAARALKNGLELCCCFDTDVPDQIIGDPGRLLQIFVNLIGNGIKFTKKGEVVVSVSVKSKTTDAVELLFAVKDTGLGIPQSKQSLLFQAFSQVDASTQRLYGGTGLGLVISSKLAAAMGGMMWVESDGIEDHGSTFFFTAKFNTPLSCNRLQALRFNIFKGVRALVVDDNETSRRILVDILKNWGMVAHGTDSSTNAKHILESMAQQGETYNVVLVDMWLNGSDSSELVHFLRENPNILGRYYESIEVQESKAPRLCEKSYKKQEITRDSGSDKDSSNQCWEASICQSEGTLSDVAFRSGKEMYSRESVISAVVVLTSVNHLDSIRCKELGLPIHTCKPVKRSLLLKAVQSALGIQEKSSHEGNISRGPQSPNRKLHLLVAEDNLVNQRVAITLLHKWGHTTVLARNGEEAVEQAFKEPFDLILMDVQMPICDGFEATAKIRELEKASNRNSTPIVAMTAHAMMGDGERCIAAGMDYYISKPLNAKKLQELLQDVATGSIRLQPQNAASMSVW